MGQDPLGLGHKYKIVSWFYAFCDLFQIPSEHMDTIRKEMDANEHLLKVNNTNQLKFSPDKKLIVQVMWERFGAFPHEYQRHQPKLVFEVDDPRFVPTGYTNVGHFGTDCSG
jgi:hypothetical protein